MNQRLLGHLEVYIIASICYTSDNIMIAAASSLIGKEGEPCQIKEECNLM